MLNKLFNHLSYYKWWKNLDKLILSLILTFFLIGLFFSLVSTSLISSDKLDTNSNFFFFKHLTFVIIGLVIIFLLSLIFLLLVPIIGIEVKGSKRWIDLYLLPRFQPIELVKPFLIICISLILSSQKYRNIYLKYCYSFLLTFFVGLLLAAQPDIGQTLLVFFSWSILIFTSGINIIFLMISFLLLTLIILYLVFFCS